MARQTSETRAFRLPGRAVDDKQALVDDVFHSVARRYDLMNDLMSAGLHRAWKDVLVTAVNPPKNDRPFAVLDLAGGTGDIAFRLVAAGGAGTQVTVLDINADMLEVGRARAAERGLDDAVTFVDGNAEALPFPDGRFDAVTIAFGIRNVPRIEARAGRGIPRAADRRPFSLPGILDRRRAGARRAVRLLFLQRDPGAGPHGYGRCRGLSVSGRIDPPLSAAGRLRRHDANRGLRPGVVPAHVRRHRGAAFRLAPVGAHSAPPRNPFDRPDAVNEPLTTPGANLNVRFLTRNSMGFWAVITDDFNAPLGQNTLRSRRRFAIGLPQVTAGALGLSLVVFAGWTILVDETSGGEPMAVVRTQPAAANPARATDEPDLRVIRLSPDERPNITIEAAPVVAPPGKTITIIDGTSGMRREVQIPFSADEKPATPEKRAELAVIRNDPVHSGAPEPPDGSKPPAVQARRAKSTTGKPEAP